MYPVARSATKDWLGDLRRKRPAMGTQTFASFSEEKVDLI